MTPDVRPAPGAPPSPLPNSAVDSEYPPLPTSADTPCSPVPPKSRWSMPALGLGSPALPDRPRSPATLASPGAIPTSPAFAPLSPSAALGESWADMTRKRMPSSPVGRPRSEAPRSPASTPMYPLARTGIVTNTITEDCRTLGALMLRMQKLTQRMERKMEKSLDSTQVAPQLKELQLGLRRAVSKLDALHRVDAARVVPTVLCNWAQNYFPGAQDLRNECQSAIAQFQGANEPLKNTKPVDWKRVSDIQNKRVTDEQIVAALQFSLDTLDDRTLAERNSAAHPSKDIEALLEWEVGSLRRLATRDEQRRKAATLDVLCICAGGAPYWANTADVRSKLADIRRELDLDRAEEESAHNKWLKTRGKRPRPRSGNGLEVLLGGAPGSPGMLCPEAAKKTRHRAPSSPFLQFSVLSEDSGEDEPQLSTLDKLVGLRVAGDASADPKKPEPIGKEWADTEGEADASDAGPSTPLSPRKKRFPKAKKQSLGSPRPQLDVPTTPTKQAGTKGHWSPLANPVSRRVI